ncbi:MAG: alpha/beta hydrolase [Gammaproteobacteria bacterium]|nr:alpha/beta hydrolase [Gammaproteobacteria bacterium]
MALINPKSWLSLTELPRAGLELSALLSIAPFLANADRGDGHPVVVLPGFLASDDSTWILRSFLKSLGYEAHRWTLGRNLGAKNMGGYDTLVNYISDLHKNSGQTVSLVGWSLGGIHALAVAARASHAVRHVITLGSPISPADANEDMSPIYYALRQTAKTINAVPHTSTPQHHTIPDMLQNIPHKLPVSAVYSCTDGVVPWRRSRIAETVYRENIEVVSSHLGLGVNPTVLVAISDRLALEEGKFTKFKRCGWRRLAYPAP